MSVLIIGSGHNALVAACYLARDGHRVEVLERDTVLGGAVSTVERFPGHQVDRGSSAHIAALASKSASTAKRKASSIRGPQ